MRHPGLWCCLVLLPLLWACGEKPQVTVGAKADMQAWQGAQDPFVAPGWKVGDQASWQEQMKKRAMPQNEYLRINAP